MQLLVTQLQNQDPLSPMDPSTFVTQLVGVTSLDQVTQINQLLQNTLGSSSTSVSTQHHRRSIMPLFSIPLSGLDASSTAMSTIANNLANLNTIGYKGSDTQFADLFYETLGTNGSGDPVQVGAGTRLDQFHRHEFRQSRVDGRSH